MAVDPIVTFEPTGDLVPPDKCSLDVITHVIGWMQGDEKSHPYDVDEETWQEWERLREFLVLTGFSPDGMEQPEP